ncbi:hypothetical protein OW492_08015 [Psychromonas sp. 14N.309.X.WAT.B.A12]|uniref:DUF6162 family protein n=1 Tax=Psychromonas sp. 14N.309.X.WAT.B.A12 TaxID=2998322 RepID=UPI0025B0998F|nr:hypothetical protein [Psychromonas sp. 14N.309.X.WAT.B.A12]MDN2663318.1 hypothetical protein [Psychromonas sp. 14N.309.X.WAT.B.A12]
MITQSVVSENRGHEGYWIAFLCALILVFGALLLPFNRTHDDHHTLAKHQVFIDDLTPTPLAMIADLRLAHEEIRYLYETNQTWPDVVQLEESWLAPFVKDKSWEHRGQHQWLLVAPGVYQSEPIESGTRYLLNSQGQTVDIWLDKDQQASLLHALTSIESNSIDLSVAQFISAGWIQVIFNNEVEDTAHHH